MVWRRGPSRILNVFIPTWLIAGAIFLAGLIMQYTYAGVSAPDSVIDAELLAHAPSLSYYDSTSTSYSFAADGSNLNPREPRPRVDNFLVVLGFILLIETLPLLQNGLANRVFMWLGKRSFSWLLIAPVVLHILGIRLALRTWDVEGWSFAAGVALSFPVCLIATVLVSDTWWRFIEMPTRRGVRGFWAWMIR
jgi:peptidoglycan/LPS O-acetylase OafA/YrhL